MVRWLRWALFKNNLSFPGNIRIGDLLSKLLQIEFDLSDSLFQGFVFVWHIFVSIWTGLLWKWIRSVRPGAGAYPFPQRADCMMKMEISDAIQEKGAPHDHLLGEPH